MKIDSLEILSGDFRKLGAQAPQTMNLNINITGASAGAGTLLLDFEYAVVYFPDNSHIRLLGKAALSGSEAEAREAAGEWAATGKISGPDGELIINAINYSASMNAVLISKALNIAPPIVLPTLTIGQEAEKQEAGKKARHPKKG